MRFKRIGVLSEFQLPEIMMIYCCTVKTFVELQSLKVLPCNSGQYESFIGVCTEFCDNNTH